MLRKEEDNTDKKFPHKHPKYFPPSLLLVKNFICWKHNIENAFLLAFFWMSWPT